MSLEELELADWRRRVQAIYAAVREESAKDPVEAHRTWQAGRDDLFLHHPQSPLPADDPLRASGVPCWPYDPALRFEVVLEPEPGAGGQVLRFDTGADGVTGLRRLGSVELPAPVDARLAVWWLEQYGGGMWIPLRDATAGTSTYGGGRYVLDTAKGADLGGTGTTLTLDLNFSYHPSCRYSPAWTCPLAPPANRLEVAIEAGERMPA